jgi:hypothetical protein
MMSRVLFDIEADGFYDEVTCLWCCVATDLDSGVTRRYSPLDWDAAIDYLHSADTLIGHNILTYDLPVIWKIYGPWYDVPKIIDTLVWSNYLRPERWGGHSLEAWGKQLGFPKGEFSEFDRYSQEMLEYCEQDVRVNIKVLEKLEEEYGQVIPGFKVFP